MSSTRTNFKFRTPTFIGLEHHQLVIELDRSLPRLYDAHASLDSTAVKGPTTGAGFSVASGTATFTGSKLGISTGLATVTNAVGSINSGATPHNFWVSALPSKTVTGGIDLYVYMPTSNADNTPILATSSTTVNWWATGTES